MAGGRSAVIYDGWRTVQAYTQLWETFEYFLEILLQVSATFWHSHVKTSSEIADILVIQMELFSNTMF